MRRLILSCIIGMAFGCTVLSLVSCHFWQSETEGGGMSASGLFSFSYRHAICIPFREIKKTDWAPLVQLTNSTKFAQAMGICAGIFGGLACVLTLFGSCLLSFCSISKKTWRMLLASSLWGAMFCQALTFLIWTQVNDLEQCHREDVECKLGIGGLFSMFACMLYFLAASVWSALALQPPKDNPGTTYVARLANNLMKQRGITWKQYPIWRYKCRGRSRQDQEDSNNNKHLPRWQDVCILVLSILLFHSSLMIVLDCRFYKVVYYDGEKTYWEGIFRYYYPPDGRCRNFEIGSFESFTAQTIASNIFAVTTVLICCLMVWLLVLMIFVLNFTPQTYKLLPILSMAAALTQALTFLGLTERNNILCADDIVDQSCSLGIDGWYCMINTIVYFFFVAPLWWYCNNPNIDSIPPMIPATNNGHKDDDDEADDHYYKDNNNNNNADDDEEEQSPYESTTVKSLDATGGGTTSNTTDMLVLPEIDTELGDNNDDDHINHHQSPPSTPPAPVVLTKTKSIMKGEGTKMD